jgi:cyclophilin family peptidyl-prolyl cis-trans isomerase
MRLAVASVTFGIAAAAMLPAASQRIIAPRGAGNRIPGTPDFAKRAAILAIEDARSQNDGDLQMLLDTARGSGKPGDTGEQLNLRRIALRTVGRLERRDMVPALMAARQNPDVRDVAEGALLLTLRANAPAEGQDEQISAAVDTLVDTGGIGILGQLPYSRREQFEVAERRLRTALEKSDEAERFIAARSLEALARRNRRLARLDEATITVLKRGASWNLLGVARPRGYPIVMECLAALLAAGAVDRDLIAGALSENTYEHRRLGALGLYSSGSTLDPDERTDLIRQALRDRRGLVRYDALRAWVRHETTKHGCDAILDALGDDDMHVALLAIDSLADRCLDGDPGEVITVRLTGELRTPPNVGSWYREAHALVAMARRDPERAKLALPFFTRHVTWQVRMYAARAAAILNDTQTLDTLAVDTNDNVRDAALPALHRLNGSNSSAATLAALDRNNYQLVRTAAMLLQGAARHKENLAAVSAALQRITAQKKDTSRDIRLLLLARMRELGSEDDGPMLERLLTDFDPVIANEAAQVIGVLTRRPATPSPQPLTRSNVPTFFEFGDNSVAVVHLDNGRSFDIVLNRSGAPLTCTRFVRLVKSRYYDGLTFHRVVPNFVIQGGSPGANEYDGDSQFMRDELGGHHSRGTVGISTRGRHTGDAQFFINLVDNRSLDYDYTQFGVISSKGMEVVDAIAEGTRISRITLVLPSAVPR